MKELDKTGAFANGSAPYNGRLESSYGYDKIFLVAKEIKQLKLKFQSI